MYLVNSERVNRSMAPKIVDARVTQIFNTFGQVLVTSSFGTTSAVLLHIVSRIRPECPVYFIDTGYHFPETLEYKGRISQLLSLNVVDLKPDPSRHSTTEIHKMWQHHSKRCCHINKVIPLDRVKGRYKVWMSGLMGHQTRFRDRLEFLEDRSDILKFHPLIDWDREQADEYMELYGLPRHPLEGKGYESIGCTHCTSPGKGRKGRWKDTGKTECGLHTGGRQSSIS